MGGIRVDQQMAVAERAVVFAGQGVARCITAEIRINLAERVDQAGLHRAQRDLVARIPTVVVGEQLGVIAVSAVAASELGDERCAALSFGFIPRPIVDGGVEPQQQPAVSAEIGRPGDQRARVAVFAKSHLIEGLRQAIDITDAHGTGGGEVAILGVVGSLAVFDRVDQFGNQSVEIVIALTVRVRTQVVRHAIDECGEVGAMVEIESAQEILVRLAVATVLGRDQAGHHLEHFSRA